MTSTNQQLKEIFREGWSNVNRVEGWVSSSLNGEFGDPACREAWKGSLERAVAGIPLGRALDLGTGPGTIAQFWAEIGFTTTGVDFSPGMLEAGRVAAAQRGLSIDFLEGDVESPLLGDAWFDVISSRFVLFTLPHPGYAMRRWIEMLQPGGALVLIGHERTAIEQNQQTTTPRPNRWQADEQYRNALQQLPFTDHTAAHLQVVMEAAGLRQIERMRVDGLLAARESFGQRTQTPGILHTTPYILVGRK